MSIRCRLGFHSYPFLGPPDERTFTSEEFNLLTLCERCKKPFDFSKARPVTQKEMEALNMREGIKDPAMAVAVALVSCLATGQCEEAR